MKHHAKRAFLVFNAISIMAFPGSGGLTAWAAAIQVQAVPTTLAPGGMGAAGAAIGNQLGPSSIKLDMQLGGMTPLSAPAAITPKSAPAAASVSQAAPLSSPLPGAVSPSAPAAASVSQAALPSSPLHGAVSPSAPAAVAVSQVPSSLSLPKSVPAAADSKTTLRSSLLGSVSPSASVSGQQAGRIAGQVAQTKALPKIDLSALAPENMSRLSDAGAREAASRVMDDVLRSRSVEGIGEVRAAAASQQGRAKGPRLAPATKKGVKQAASKKPAASKKEAPAKKQPAAKDAKAAAEKPYNPKTRPFSPNRLSNFQKDLLVYIMEYVFGQRMERLDKGYELVTGLSVHKALEKTFTRIKNGTPGKDIKVSELIAEYDKAWDETLKEGGYKAREGWTPEDFKRRGQDYLRRRYQLMFPFEDMGKIVGLEMELNWKMTDPMTGNSFNFKGIIDRLMVKGDTVEIHDWKTHFNPPSTVHLDRDDFQLGLYAWALKSLYPDLVKGKKIKLVWDYREFSQSIEVDDAYLQKIQERVFSIIRASENYVRLLKGAKEKAEWEKRLDPDANPVGQKAAEANVDQIGEIQGQLDEKGRELRRLKREYDLVQEGVARYASRAKIERIEGETHALTVQPQTKTGLPTKAEDPDAHEAVADIVRQSGAWEDFSNISYAAIRRMAQTQGDEDNAVFLKMLPDLVFGMANGLELHPADERPSIFGKGSPKSKLPRQEWAPDAEPGLLSPTQVATFMQDQDLFAKKYVLRAKGAGEKNMDMLVGLACHETMEAIFTWIKGGKRAQDFTLEDVYKYMEDRFADLKSEGDWAAEPGVTDEEYKARARAFIKAKWDKFQPFDKERVVFLESRMHYTLTDPQTSKTYKFQGIPDQVMLDGDTLIIRDWKTHYNEPSDQDIRTHDYQLGLYILALRQLYPELVKGRKVKLVWELKSKQVVIDADEKYIADLQKRIFGTLREMDAFREKVVTDRQTWEEKLGVVKLPKGKGEAAAMVDRLGALAGKIEKLDAEIKKLKGDQEMLQAQVRVFMLHSGQLAVRGKDHVVYLKKYGYVDVPTKTDAPQAQARIVSLLKEAGVWEKYSQLDLPALKRALADPASMDRKLFKKLQPYIRELTTHKVKLVELEGAGATK